MLLIVACSHSFAKVTAIVWALQLARDEKIQSIIVKVDSKIYVDALKKKFGGMLGNLASIEWYINIG